MDVSIPDPLSRLVKSMCYFILRLHFNNKGKDKVEALADVCSLSEPLRSLIMNFFNKCKDEYDQKRCQCITPNPNCMKILMDDFNISFLEPNNDIKNPEDFILWCFRLCFQSAHLFEHEFAEAPDIAIEFIIDMCKNNNKYESFCLAWV